MPGRKDPKYNGILEMYNSGASIEDIASKYGVTRQAIHKALKTRGYTPRSNLKYGVDNHFYRGTEADHRVHNIVTNAIARGRLVPKDFCECCLTPKTTLKDGRNSLIAHHCDYNKPLDVMWLCSACHFNWHENNTPTAKVDIYKTFVEFCNKRGIDATDNLEQYMSTFMDCRS